MKPVPTPKQEVIVRKDGGRFIRVTTHTADAEAWLVKHAPAFGLLFGAIIEGEKEQLLIVYEGYDVNEVADYLDSYNDPE